MKIYPINNDYKLASIDLETTGLTPGIHEICEISIIILNDSLQVTNKFVTLVKPLRPSNIEKNSMLINKIPIEELMNAPVPSEVREAFFDWSEDYRSLGEKILPLGWNYPDFDKPFLLQFFGKENYNKLFSYHSIDLKGIFLFLKSVGYFQGCESHSLSNVCEYFQIPHKAHEALGDTYAVASLYKEFIKLLMKGN